MRVNQLVVVAALFVAGGSVRAEIIFGVTDPSGGFDTTGNLVSFDSANPAAFTTIGPITGLTAGQQLRGIDFRPATGQLYALSSVTADPTTAQLYTVNLTTAVATPVGAALSLTGNTSSRISLDFNPVVDRLRVVTSGTVDAGGAPLTPATNYRIHPTTGAVTRDTDLTNAAAPANTRVTDIAYNNNVAGAATTTLFALEYNSDALHRVGNPSPNDGVMTPIGGFGGPSQFNLAVGFDISGATGVGYVSLDELDSPTAAAELYSVDLATGSLTLLANEINGLTLLDLSVFIAPVPEPATVGLTAAAGLGLARLVRRRVLGGRFG